MEFLDIHDSKDLEKVVSQSVNMETKALIPWEMRIPYQTSLIFICEHLP